MNFIPKTPGILAKDPEMFKKLASNAKVLSCWRLNNSGRFEPFGAALVAIKNITTKQGGLTVSS